MANSNQTSSSEELTPEEMNQTPGSRAAQVNSDPNTALEEARNANEGKEGNASGSVAPSEAEKHVPASSSSESSDLPSSR